MKRAVFILSLFLIGYGPLYGQFLQDKTATAQALKGLDHLYNLQFAKAEAEFAPIKAKYKDHPVTFLLNAFQIQWQNIPIDDHPAALSRYQQELQKCVDAAYKYYEIKEYKEESTFFLIAGHGFLALVENYKEKYWNAAQEGRKLIRYFKEGKQFKNSNPEFLFVSGLYNYYRERYPEAKPMIKPLMVFFEAGNKPLGLRELERSHRTSVFSRIEAATYLWDIYIRYESNFAKALTFSGALHNKYPNNFVFRIAHIESLLLNMKWAEAATANSRLASLRDPVASLSYNTFEGYLAEHQLKDYKKAKTFYEKAITIKHNDRYTKEYKAYSYLGLARIAAHEGNTATAKKHYRECLKYAEYSWLNTAAKNEMKALP